MGTGLVALKSALLEEIGPVELCLEGKQLMRDNVHLRNERTPSSAFPEEDNYAKDFFRYREAVSTVSSVSFVYVVLYVSRHATGILHCV